MNEDQAIEETWCFVDVAGFTALTDVHGDVAAADLVERFVLLVRDALGDQSRLVNTVGDAVFVTCDDPIAAVEFLDKLFRAADSEADFPTLRAGIHHGPVVKRGGSVFGASVNLAARVAGQARGGQILATRVVARLIEPRAVETTDLGKFRLRNIAEPVGLVAVHVAKEGSSKVLDPVCRMSVAPEHAPARLRHGGADYWFCSLARLCRNSLVSFG